jgi:hypothetical protein
MYGFRNADMKTMALRAGQCIVYVFAPLVRGGVTETRRAIMSSFEG